MVSGLLLSLIGFFEVSDDVFSDPLEGDYEVQTFDQTIAQFVRSIESPLLTQSMIDLTSLGSLSVIFVMSFVLSSVLYTYRDYKGLSYLFIVLAGAGLWPTLLKLYFKRERPPLTQHLVNVTDLSFPSGHAFGAAALYFALAYYSAQYTRNWYQEIFFYILGGTLIILVGVSRIYLGVHFPTDVLAGVSGGLVWVLLVSLIFEVTVRRKRDLLP
jgi:undecaprenyl-diphosphatase